MKTAKSECCIVSTACRFPEADTLAELWDNVLSGRRASRNIPPKRLPLDAYAAEAVGSADSTTPIDFASCANDISTSNQSHGEQLNAWTFH